jgi:TolB-like protein
LVAAAIILVGIQVYLGGSRPAAIKSVAVLPFVDLSADGEQTWLADGLAEEVLNSLTQLPELKVTARTSSFQFRNQTGDVREIAERLGVANVLEGSVQSAGDKLLVTAQLIRAADGFHLWSSDYTGTTSDLFTFQRDVAERVAVALDVVLDESRRTRMFASGTRNVEAFREYQEGWRIYNLVHSAQTQQTLWDANRHFERAMVLDPKFALGAVGRTDAFMHFLIQPRIAYVASSPWSREQALELLRQTFDFITENSPTATMRLAYQIQRESFSPTWERMPFLLAELRQHWDVNALTFGSGVDGALWLPVILSVTGQHDLVRAIAVRHVTNDPLSVDAWIQRVGVEIRAREFNAARDVLAQARRKLGPSSLLNEEFRIALLEGDRAKATEVLKLLPTPLSAMDTAAINGDYATALRIADELEKRISDPLGSGSGALLYVYYETGAAERASVLVRRIDESPVGTEIFTAILAQNFGEPYFDFKDAPNFVAKLKQARIDPASFRPMPRLSALQ